MAEAVKATPQLVSRSDLRRIGIVYSREHLWRLEAVNKFPRRIYLSAQKVAWLEDEILEWIAQRTADRAHRIYRTHN